MSEQPNNYVLVTGAAGYIGSHMLRVLQDAGYSPVALDNLSSGSKEAIPKNVPFFKGDISDEKLIQDIFTHYPFTSVIHFAAFIQVGESVKDPLKYYANNVAATITLLHTLQKLGVENIVFSSTAAVYGEPIAKLDEQHIKSPLNAYGRGKSMVEEILRDCVTYGIHVTCLRYFNVAGADPAINAGKRRVQPTNLIPVVLQAIIHHQSVTVFGKDYATNDGTCMRDYIHVMDLCSAHLRALEKQKQETVAKFSIYNLGTGQGHSVLEVIREAEKVTNQQVNIVYGSRRSGDAESMVAEPSLAHNELNWRPQYSTLNRIVTDAWQYECKRTQQMKSPKKNSWNSGITIALALGVFAVGYQIITHLPEATPRPKI